MNTKYVGSTTRLCTRTIVNILVIAIVAYIGILTLEDIDKLELSWAVYTAAVILFGIRFLCILNQKTMSIEITEHQWTIGSIFSAETVYEQDKVVVDSKTRVIYYSGAPVFNRTMLLLNGLDGIKIKKYNMSGFKTKEIPVILNALNNQQKNNLDSVSSESQKVPTEQFDFKPQSFDVGISPKAINAGAKRITSFLGIVLLLMAAVAFVYGLEEIFASSIQLAGFLLFLRLILGLRKNPHKYPKTVTVGQDELMIDQQKILYTDIKHIFYTPVDAQRVFLTLTIQLQNGKSIKRLFGIQYWSGKAEPGKFSNYPEFIQALYLRFQNDPSILIEDVNFANTDRVYR